MQKYFIHLAFLLCWTFVQGQDFLSAAKEIRTLEEAQRFADSLEQVNVGFMHAEIENPEYLARMRELQPGDTYLTGHYHVVVISEGTKDIYRFRLLSLTEKNSPNAAVKADELLNELQNGTPFEQLHAKHAENKTDDASNGDVGWVDLDFFIRSFQRDVKAHQKGDQFVSGDPELGWYNVVDMTHAPQKMQGHYVLFFPEAQQKSFQPIVNHEKNLGKLKTTGQFKEYTEEHPGDVSLLLINPSSNADLYAALANKKATTKKKEPIFTDFSGTRYRYLKDTTVSLYSIQYVYLNGSEMTRDAKNDAVHDIYDQFYANVPMDSIVAQYWPNNNGLSILRNIDGALLADDLVTKVNATTVGQLFVARVGQSYFLGVPLEKPKKEAAFLVITYPKPSDE